jgi:hypothetical protein
MKIKSGTKKKALPIKYKLGIIYTVVSDPVSFLVTIARKQT